MDDHADSAGAEIAELCQTLHKFDLDFAKKSQHEFTAEQALIDARDADAVRRPCPGPLRAMAAGGVQVDLGGAVEGSMRGAVEPR